MKKVLLRNCASHEIELHDIGILPTKTAHAECSSQGEVEACVGLHALTFDFASSKVNGMC
jgi:hypothetical protein